MKGEQFPLGWTVSNQVQNTEHFNPFSVGLADCPPERTLQSQERATPALASFPAASKSGGMGGSEKNGRLIGGAVQDGSTDALSSCTSVHREEFSFFFNLKPNNYKANI